MPAPARGCCHSSSSTRRSGVPRVRSGGPTSPPRCAPSTPPCAGATPVCTVLHGDPVREVQRAARGVDARRVHVAADYGPYGRRRDLDVEEALAEHDVALVRTGSPYAVAPGRVLNGSGAPYQVFTPFARAWAEHGWRGPVDPPTDVHWLGLEGADGLPEETPPEGVDLPDAGERAALARWEDYVENHLGDYHDEPRPARPPHHLPDVGAPEVGRDPPAHDAGRALRRHPQGRRHLPQGAGLAGVLRRRAAPATGDRTRLPATRVRPDGLRRTRASSSRPGRRVAPATRSSMPGCVSCGRPAGCTIACG